MVERVARVQPGTRPELAEVEAAILGARGRISPLYQVLLNSAPVAAGWESLLTAVRQRTQVPPALRELMILRVAVLNGARFEFDAHVEHALKAGLTTAQIEAVREAEPPFDGDERLVLELADAMTRHVVVPDALFERLRARFDEPLIVELVATVAAYNMVSRLLVALGIEH